MPELNTTSTADISFMLLAFFLVTTSMDSDKGLARRLPPPEKPGSEAVKVKRRDVIVVELLADDSMTAGGRRVTAEELRHAIMDFVENADNRSDRPEKHLTYIELLGDCHTTRGHVVAVEANRNASYGAYFRMQTAIVAAYAELRDRLARRRFGKAFADCTPGQRRAVAEYYPQRISETTVAAEGGGR